MSTYRREMEREYSARSLSTRASSDRGSLFNAGAGIFISSFAATVFISGLVIFGISVLSLLVALTVMLRSCESRNSGVVEMNRDAHMYDYCRNFALHAELNNLGSDVFPTACEDINIQYIKEGQYMRDLNATIIIAEEFFSTVRLQMEDQDVVIMDADDLLASETSLSNLLTNWMNEDSIHHYINVANYVKNIFSVKLYKKLQSAQWPLILWSRRPEKMRNSTIESLASVGCHGWSSLIMRLDNEMQVAPQEFFLRQRAMLQKDGLRIIAVVSSQMDALTWQCFGGRLVKLPSPIFRYNMKGHDENQTRKSKSLHEKV